METQSYFLLSTTRKVTLHIMKSLRMRSIEEISRLSLGKLRRPVKKNLDGWKNVPFTDFTFATLTGDINGKKKKRRLKDVSIRKTRFDSAEEAVLFPLTK